MNVRFRLTRTALVLITIAASAIALISGDQGHGWFFVAGHFIIAWAFMVAFAMLGKAMFGKR